MTSLQALLGFGAWTLLMVFVVVNWRVLEILRGKKANSWTRGAEAERPALVKRAEHAHMNCVENLPLFAVIVLGAAALGKSAVTDPVAGYVLYARIGQSVVHLLGTSHWLVLVRATFWTIQIGLFAYMFWGLLA